MLPDTVLEKIKFELESIERELRETEQLFNLLRNVDPDPALFPTFIRIHS